MGVDRMILKYLKLKNFRGYENLQVSFDKDMNVIIGKNDIGKSTIIEALDIFFNGNTKDAQTKLDIDDLSIYHKEPIIEISCIFEDDNSSLIIDSTNKTTLKEEFLLNKNGLLEIKKVWSCKKEKISASDLKVYINANYPKIDKNPLINMKIEQLKKMMEKIKDGIDNYELIHKNKSAEIRKSLYKYYIEKGCEFEETLIDINKEDAKNIWNKILENLPIFFLFKSDRSNVDSDSEVQNPLKIATKNVLREISDELERIKNKVEEAVKVIGENTIEKLKEMDEDIALNLETQLTTKAWDSIFSFEVIDGRGVPLNKRGSGIRRLMLLSYFRAEAERIIGETNKSNIIYAIEEPETSQHPNYQTMIMETLLTISTDFRHQVIITTHTPEIAKMVSGDKIIFIDKDRDRKSYIIEEEKSKIEGVIKSLGILPDVYTKLILCVEGSTDVQFFENISELESLKKIIDLKNENISILPMKGGNLKSWINNDYLKNSNVREIHIYDSDIKEYKEIVEKMNKESDGRRLGWITERLEIENYIPPKLIEKGLNINIEKEIKDNWIKEDVPKLLMKKYGQSRKMKEIDIKSILNGSISKRITEHDLKEIGAYEEIEKWFKSIKSMYSYSNNGTTEVAVTSDSF